MMFADARKILEEMKLYNESRNILRSENVVIDRLLASGASMTSVYGALPDDTTVARRVLECIVSTAAFWSPEAASKARDDAQRLRELNEAIAAKALELGDLLERRERISNASGVAAVHDDLYAIDWIDRAGDRVGRFDVFIRPELARLRGSFDLKYWPSLAGVIYAIAEFARDADVGATDPLTKAATASRKRSVYDFVRALLAALSENDIVLPDAALADVTSVLFAETDADDIKSLRHRG